MLMEKFTKVSDTSRTIVALSIVAIIALAMYNWVVSPQTAYLAAAQQQDRLLTDSSNKYIEIENEIKTSEVEATERQADINDMQAKFFSVSKCRDFFGSLEELLKQSNCTLASLIFEEDSSIAGQKDQQQGSLAVSAKSIRLHINGQYNDIKSFLKVLRACPEEIAIVDMTIATDDNNARILTCNILLKVYILGNLEITNNEE